MAVVVAAIVASVASFYLEREKGKESNCFHNPGLWSGSGEGTGLEGYRVKRKRIKEIAQLGFILK